MRSKRLEPRWVLAGNDSIWTLLPPRSPILPYVRIYYVTHNHPLYYIPLDKDETCSGYNFDSTVLERLQRRQRRISPALSLLDKATPLLRSRDPVSLFYVLFISSCYLDSGRKANSTDVMTKTRTLYCASSAMSREDYLATAMLRSSDSKAGVSPSVRRQTSHNVYYVQVVQLLSERRYQTTNSSPSCPVRLESHKPPRVAPILQTGVRSRSFTGTDPKFFGILSFPTCRKVMLFSLPSILLDGGSLPLRRSSTGDLFHGADEWPKSFVIRPMLTALIEVISFYIWVWPICRFEPVSPTIYLQGPKSVEENLI
ncbi:hypothetical protein YC2023_112888 [Brassica napus]